ncbi:alpha/beta hydrolase [Bordetella sp. H567]|uniref:alpha/beta fold hydrolase n=1 Tax=Bordetella sp. H567 TaxID=1697043 RepID=UPI00081C3227|nr:alpha/beta hydrolase [Bordetella sp. H567]AOB29442.1 alpha/beta hydrolase [Bordetella sp. H567]
MPALQRIVSGRAVLAAETVGTGHPVVFLHAVVGDRRMWSAQLDATGRQCQAIAYDRRGFGETSAQEEDASAVADLMAVIDGVAGGAPAILVGCSQGGRIALDAALRHPTRVRGLVLIAPSVTGAPDITHPPEIAAMLARQKQAEDAGDLDRLNAIRARLWLDGPLAPEGRVAGPARALFTDMNAIALRSPPVGASLDTAAAFPRLGEISAPTLLLWGELDFPHIQERSRHIAHTMPNATGQAIADTAHLPSLERPQDVTPLILDFVQRCARAGH